MTIEQKRNTHGLITANDRDLGCRGERELNYDDVYF